MREPMRRCLGAVAKAGLLASLAACQASAPVARAETFAPFMTPAQEAEVGRREHPKILARFGGVYDDPEVGGYVATIGGSLVANSELPRYPFTFTVLNSPDVNAFALPGGYVYVTRGVLALANSEAELAGVLAHEIGHVVARHSAQRYSRSVIANLGAAVLGLLIDNPQLNQLAQIGGELYLTGYSRQQEYEADLLGVRYLIRTGYNPWAQARFLESLEAEHQLSARLAGQDSRGRGLDFFSTHPRTSERIQRAIEAAGTAEAGDGRPWRRDEYLRHMDGLLFGDDPEQGFVRGRVFAHPKLRFTFTVPPGFRTFNHAQAVVARGPRGALIRLDGDARRGADDMVDYLTRVWAPELRLRSVEALRVNGMEAASGTARVSDQGEPFDVRLVAIRFSPGQIYRFLFATPPDLTRVLGTDLRRTTFSFRRLGRTEAVELRELRLRMVRVGPGDTPQSLAAFMAPGELKLERFLVLNGLKAEPPLELGQVVKLVQE